MKCAELRNQQADLEEWNWSFIKWCLEQIYDGKGAIGKRKQKQREWKQKAN